MGTRARNCPQRPIAGRRRQPKLDTRSCLGLRPCVEGGRARFCQAMCINCIRTNCIYELSFYMNSWPCLFIPTYLLINFK